MPNPEAGLLALQALVKAATEVAGKAVPIAEKFLPARLSRTLPELIKSARMETELAGSKAGELRGIKNFTDEMPVTRGFITSLGKKKSGRFSSSNREEIESAVNMGAGQATGKFDFFNPRQLPLEKSIRSKAGSEIRETVPKLGLLPKSRDLQKLQDKIKTIVEEHQTRFGETPSENLISRRLNSKYGLKLPPGAVQRLRAGIVEPGGPFSEFGQLPTRELRLDAPVPGREGSTMGDFIPESVKTSPEAYGSKIGGATPPQSRGSNLEDAITALTDKQKKALMDYYVEGKTQSEIATDMGISQKNVNKLIQKGVEHVKAFVGSKRTVVPRKTISGGAGGLDSPEGLPAFSTRLLFNYRPITESPSTPTLRELHEFMSEVGQPPQHVQRMGTLPATPQDILLLTMNATGHPIPLDQLGQDMNFLAVHKYANRGAAQDLIARLAAAHLMSGRQ